MVVSQGGHGVPVVGQGVISGGGGSVIGGVSLAVE